MTKEEKKEYMKIWNKNHPEYMKIWNKNHPGYITIESRIFRQDLINKEYNRRCSLRYIYYSKPCSVYMKDRIYNAKNYFDAIFYIWSNGFSNNCEIRSTRNKLISDIKDIITILPKHIQKIYQLNRLKIL
jgi:hypothetical protein